MKRYECPHCNTKYLLDLALCPVCGFTITGTDESERMICHSTESDQIITEESAVSREIATGNGFAAYNLCPHLCVEAPDTNFTISVRLSDGRRVTFAFTPIDDSYLPEAVDIIYHGKMSQILGQSWPLQDLLLFPKIGNPQGIETRYTRLNLRARKP